MKVIFYYSFSAAFNYLIEMPVKYCLVKILQLTKPQEEWLNNVVKPPRPPPPQHKRGKSVFH